MRFQCFASCVSCQAYYFAMFSKIHGGMCWLIPFSFCSTSRPGDRDSCPCSRRKGRTWWWRVSTTWWSLWREIFSPEIRTSKRSSTACHDPLHATLVVKMQLKCYFVDIFQLHQEPLCIPARHLQLHEGSGSRHPILFGHQRNDGIARSAAHVLCYTAWSVLAVLFAYAPLINHT